MTHVPLLPLSAQTTSSVFNAGDMQLPPLLSPTLDPMQFGAARYNGVSVGNNNLNVVEN